MSQKIELQQWQLQQQQQQQQQQQRQQQRNTPQLLLHAASTCGLLSKHSISLSICYKVHIWHL
jgi:hypothetical protein